MNFSPSLEGRRNRENRQGELYDETKSMVCKKVNASYRIIGLMEMRMEASIILNCSNYSDNIIDILKLFQQIGWDIYNPQGETEYLPIGDDDEFDWQCEKITEIKLFDIVSEKMAKKELIGVNLFYNNGVEGISLLADTTEQVMLSISINRKINKGKYTDMIWYLENIIYKFFDIGIRLLSYKLEEYED